jgi:hypothetical protein
MSHEGPHFNMPDETSEDLDAIGKLIDSQNERRSEKIVFSLEQTATALAQKYSLLEKDKNDFYERLDQIDKELRAIDAKPGDTKEIKTLESGTEEVDPLDEALAYEKLYQESVELEKKVRAITKQQVTIDKEVEGFTEQMKDLYEKLRKDLELKISRDVSPKLN